MSWLSIILISVIVYLLCGIYFIEILRKDRDRSKRLDEVNYSNFMVILGWLPYLITVVTIVYYDEYIKKCFR